LATFALTKKQIVKFAPRGSESFYDNVKKKVDEYFRTNEIVEHANIAMKLKTVAMLSMYFVPYLFIVTGLLSAHLLLFYCSWVVMAVGLVGIGTGIMHDSNHGSYSSNKLVNKLLGNLMNVIGGCDTTWKIQHNILHHTYTNVEGLDEDIDSTVLLRMSPHKPLLKVHRFQHLYAWFLYTLMTLMWIGHRDYKLLKRYELNDLIRKEKITFKKAVTRLTIFKAIYFSYILILPFLFSGVAWYHLLIGFVIMHMIAGLLLACIFQLAHVMPTSEYPMPVQDNKMENNWAVHQLLTTTNFAPKSKILSWYVGGLNFQIEHHLFPHICHVHYAKISQIVQNAASQYGLPYQVQPTFVHALWQHGKMLKQLGSSN